MKIPRVNPIGIVETGPDYDSRPRTYPRRVRVAALIVLSAFTAASVVTTVVSLGAYCLTTYGGSPVVGYLW